MAADGTIKIELTAETKGAVSSLEKLGGVAKTALAGIGTAVAAGSVAIGKLAIDSLKARGELEQNMGGSEAVFKDFAKTVQDVGKTAFKDMGLSMSDFLANANKMGALLQGAGFTIEESADLSAKAMQRAADVASIMGIDVSAAMEAVTGAAKGNFTMMDNLGVAMNATTIEAYALSKGIDKSYNSMTNQEKIGLAMELFLEKTAYAAGNYAKENETLAGSLTTAKAAMQNFLSGAGSVDDLIDSLMNAAKIISKNLIDLLPGLVKGVISVVNAMIPQIPPMVNKMLPVIVEGGMKLVNALADTILDNAPLFLDTAKEIVKVLARGLGDAIPILKPLTSLIEFLAEHLEAVLAVVVPLTAAFIAYQAAVAISGIITAVTAALGGMTIAQYALNLAMSLNPVGLIVAGVTALIALVAILIPQFSQVSEETKQMAKEADDLKKASESVRESIVDSAKAHDENMDSMLDEAKASQKLADNLLDLARKNDTSVEGRARLAAAADTLNQAMGETVAVIDEETGLLETSEKAIRAQVEARREMAEATARQERAVEIMKERIAVEDELAGVSAKRAELETQLGFTMDDYNEKGAMQLRITGDITEANKPLVESLVTLNEEEMALALTQDALTIAWEANEAAMVEAEANKQAAVAETAAAVGAASEEIATALTETQKEAITALVDDYKTLETAATDMFSRLSDESDVGVKTMTKNLEENQRVVSEWADNLDKLAKKGVDVGIIETLRRGGLEAAGETKNLVNASDAEIQKLNTAFQEGGDTAREALKKALGVTDEVVDVAVALAQQTADGLKETLDSADFTGMGTGVAEGLAQGIRDRAETAVAAAREMARAVEAAARAKLDTHSPSRLFEKIGVNVGEGFVLGIESMAGKIGRAVDNTFSDFTPRINAWNTGRLVSAATASGNGAGAVNIYNTNQIATDYDVSRLNRKMARQYEESLRDRGRK